MKHFLLTFSLTMAIAAGFLAWRSHSAMEAEVAGEPVAPSVQNPGPPPINGTAPSSGFSPKFRRAAAQMDQISRDPRAEEKILHELAQALSAADAANLRELALDPKAKRNERFTAVFLLAKRVDFFSELAAVATAPPNESPALRDFERALRMEAMQGMEGQYPDPDALAAAFSRARENFHDPFLRQLAAIGEDGARKRRPFVKDFLDAKLRGASHAR